MERFEIANKAYYKDPSRNVKFLPEGTIVYGEKIIPGMNLTDISDEFSFAPAGYENLDKYVITVPDTNQKITVSAYYLFPYPETNVIDKKTNYVPLIIGAGILALIALTRKKKKTRRKTSKR